MSTIANDQKPMRLTWDKHVIVSALVEHGFQALVTVILLQLSTDEQAVKAGTHLVNQEGFSLDWVTDTPNTKIASIIKHAGKQNLNAGCIKDIAITIKRDFLGKSPSTLEGLMSLQGVGSKSAIVTLKMACGLLEAVSQKDKKCVTCSQLGP